MERLSPAIAGFSIGGVPVLDVRPRYWKQKKKVAIYMHDGGFMLYSAASTLGRAALFADDTVPTGDVSGLRVGAGVYFRRNHEPGCHRGPNNFHSRAISWKTS